MVSSGTMKSSPQHRIFKVRISSDLVSQVHGVFENRNLLQPLDNKDNTNQLCVGNVLDNHNQPLKMWLLVPGIREFLLVSCSWEKHC